jgi:lipopolysaccharide/colanic/teichoic acid biosynthesis glycosyltransferase
MSVFTFKEQIFSQYHWLDQITSEQHLLQGPSYLMAKRAIDLVLILLILPLVTPVLILCGILIKLEDRISLEPWLQTPKR